MTDLRQHPDTERLAERIPADHLAEGESPWFTYWWDKEAGLTVAVLTEDDVAGWTPVEVRPT